MRTKLFIALMLMLPGWLQARRALTDREYTIVHYTKEDGLPVENLKNLEWDPETETLFMGTEGGLVSWNGIGFNTNDQLGRIRNLVSTPGRGLYVVSEFFDVYALRQGSLSWIRSDQQRMMALYHFFTHPGPGTLQPVMASAQQYRNSGPSPIGFFPLDNGLHKALLFSASGVYAVTDTSWKLLYERQALNWTTMKDNSGRILGYDDSITFEFRNGALQQKAWKGLPRDMAGKGQWILNTNLGYPCLLYKGTLWMTEDGEQFRPLNMVDSLPADIYIVGLRRLGNSDLLAIATSAKGLYVLRPKVVQTRMPLWRGKLAGSAVTYGQAEVAPGSVLTYDGIAGNQQFVLPHHLPDHVNSYFAQPGKALWYDSANIWCRLDLHSDRKSEVNNTDGLYSLPVSVDGKLLFITRSCIYELKDSLPPRLLFRSPAPFGRRTEDWTRSMTAAVQSAPGELAFAVGRDLLIFNLNTRKLSRYPVTQKSPVRTLANMDGYLFMGTYGEGIWCRRQGTIRKLPLDKNNALRYAHCFMPDSLGGVWISSNDGLFRAGLASLKAAFADSGQAVYYHHLGQADGIRNTEFNGGCTPCALQLSNGALSFPTMEGLVWVWPDTSALMLPSGKIIPHFSSGGSEMVIAPDGILLNPGAMGRLAVTVEIPSAGGRRNVYATYRMKGYDDRWYAVPENDPLVYNALPPGSYTLEIKVLTGFGPADYAINTVPVKVVPPWYRSDMAYLSAYVLAGLLLYMLYRWRLRRVRRRAGLERLVVEEQLKTLRAQVNPHFLQDTFAFIEDHLDDGSMELSQDVIHKLSAYLRSVLDSSYEQVMSLEEELEVVEEFMSVQEMLAGDALHYEMQLDDDVDVFGIDVPAMFLQPVMEHALQHSRSGYEEAWISLHIANQGDTVLCTISCAPVAHGSTGKPKPLPLPEALQVTDNRLRVMYKLPGKQPAITCAADGDLYTIEIRLPGE